MNFFRHGPKPLSVLIGTDTVRAHIILKIIHCLRPVYNIPYGGLSSEIPLYFARFTQGCSYVIVSIKSHVYNCCFWIQYTITYKHIYVMIKSIYCHGDNPPPPLPPRLPMELTL